MRVNMFKLRLTMDAQPRSKIGHPPHRTTGVASANSNHREWTARYIVAISAAASGKLNQNLRSIATYSGLTSSRVAAVNVAGSSAMPHLGQDPGPICRTSGCIGHVYSIACIASGCAAG